jgi:ATP-dependent DNA helicase RecG
MMDSNQLMKLIEAGESLETEFKSDRRRINDREIYEEIVALANTSGGVLLIGVEDDGTITGAKPRHGKATDPFKLQSAIFNNTVPNINTRISLMPVEKGLVLAIEVDSYPEPCATSEGRSLHRTIKADGGPQSVPFYPRDQRSRRVDLGLLDFSAQTIEDVSFDDLDPLEFERLRQTVVRLRGDRSLLELSNEDIAKALRLVESQKGILVPNIAGLLLLGREEVIRDKIPTHAVYFQVFDDQSNVRVNDALRYPLIRLISDIETRFSARVEEDEVLVGFYRVPIPDYSLDGFREAVNNAVLHRDYTRLDAAYIQWYPDHILITSPGGLPPGITMDNILVHEPKPKNPLLAEAFKRIGIIEQTGRGVDRIFMGQLRYGRHPPDYGRSDMNGVRVNLEGGEGSRPFAAFVYERDKDGHRLNLDDLILLNIMYENHRTDLISAQKAIQRDSTETRRNLEALQGEGLIVASKKGDNLIYDLSPEMYERLGLPGGPASGDRFDRIRQEELVMEYVLTHGRITRGEVVRLLGISDTKARRVLERMRAADKLKPEGKPPRWVYYVSKS